MVLHPTTYAHTPWKNSELCGNNIFSLYILRKNRPFSASVAHTGQISFQFSDIRTSNQLFPPAPHTQREIQCTNTVQMCSINMK